MAGRWPRPAAVDHTSIGPDGSAASDAAAFLTRNAVDALPAGGPGAQARGGRARGAAAARQARPRPDGARHPPRPHGRAAEAARVPGPRPPGRPDRRRLHGARRRPERALDARGRCCRARRSTPTRGPTRSRRSRVLRDDPELLRAALQLRVARHADGGALPPGAHDDRRADARARRLRQALRRARADLGARAALPAACRATTRSRSAPTSSSAAPTRRSTCCSRATSSAPTASPSRRS